MSAQPASSSSSASAAFAAPDGPVRGRSAAVVLELRPGDGGADAEAFAAELTAAFLAWGRRRGWSTSSSTGAARTSVVTLSGAGVEAAVRFAGVHRVQRVPRSDPHGRRHTSTVTVAVLPAQPAAAAGELDRSEVRVDVMRGTGPGGQHRNKTESSVRAVHVPTGTSVTLTRGRSQQRNRQVALTELSRRLAVSAGAAARADRAAARAGQVAAALTAGGAATAKAFTYNDQRGEVLEHATGVRWDLQRFLRGQLG